MNRFTRDENTFTLKITDQDIEIDSVKPEHLLARWGYYQNWLSSEVNDNMISLTSPFDQNNKDDSATSKVYFCKSKHNFTV